MDTDMQHGLTRAESPDVTAYLRETTSGSMTEVPRIISLFERETEYFESLRASLAERQAQAGDEKTKASLQKELDEIDATLQTLAGHINIVGLLDHLNC